MCEFCEGQGEVKSCNFCGEAKMGIIGTTLEVWGNSEKIKLFKRIYHPRFVIKYCPLCGRKLSEVSE